MIDPKDLPKLPGQCCGNCQWFYYIDVVSKHSPPRFPLNAGGRCEWPMPVIAWPISIRQEDWKFTRRQWVWISDGPGCPAWAAGANVAPKRQP